MRFQSKTSVFKLLRRSVNGKHFMRFLSETSVFKCGVIWTGNKNKISVFKFLQRSVNGKHLMRFQSKTSVFKFLRRNMDGS